MKIAYNPITAEALTTAPANNDITFDLRGLNIFVKGVKFKGTDTTYSVFKKHTSSGGGYNGLVPVPSYTSTNTRFLREDGTWQVPSNQYTYSSLTNQDLDTLKTEGKWYYLGGNNTVTNGPTNINGGGELYVGRNASGYRYLKVILADGLIWFRKWNSQSWSPWKRWYTDANTDSKVLLSNTTTTNYRPVILGYNNSTSTSNLSNNITEQVYTTTAIYAQPSTGNLWANKLYSGGKPVLTEHQSLANYVTLNTTLIITGSKTFSNPINSSFISSTHLDANKGRTIINSTANAGSYTMLFKGNSTNGYFTHGVYLSKYLLQYTAKSTVDAGTNAVTKLVTLLDESGNSLFSGNVTAPKFIGPLLGNADSATKLTTSAGSSSLPVYFLEGKPLACSPSSLFSNLSNSGNNISVTVAGQNRTLTINYANKANKLYSYILPNSGSDKRGWYCKIASISIPGRFISKSALLCITDEYTTTSNYPRYGFIYVKVQLLGELGTSPNITLRISGSLTTSLVTGILTLSSSSSKLDIYLKEDLFYLVGYVSFIHGREDIRTNSQELILTLPLGTIINSQYGDISNQTLSLLNSRKINGTSFNGTTDITTSYWGPTRTITLTGAVTGTVSTNGSGNIIINTTYDTNNISDLDSRYVNITGDTMTGELKLKYINALRLIQGNYGVIHRNDGQNYYILLTNPGNAVNGTYNPLRPLLINLSTGYITFSNTSINGGCSITGGLNLGTSSGANLKVNNTNIIRWNGLEYKNLIISSTGGTMYLRPNGDSSTDGQVTIDTNGIVLSNKFVKMGSSDSYILLGGGGHKAVSDFALASSLNNYVTLNTAQTISGVKTFSTLLKFTVANGTSPFSVTSNTLVNNLNADLLDGMHSSSFLLLLTISGTIDVSLLKDTRLYYTTSDGGSQELVNSPFNKTFSMILVTNLINGDTDWRRSAIAFNPDGEARIFNDRGTSGDGGVWYTILTSGNYSSIVDTRYVTSLGTSGNYLTWTKNGTANNITIPYATSASKWTTARTITLGSYLSGSVNLDGSANVTLNANVIGLTSQGLKNALSGTAKPLKGLRMYEVYNNGYPTTFGNLISVSGSGYNGAGELLLSWNNGNRIYYRSIRDITDSWLGWSTVAFLTDNVASATNADKLDGVHLNGIFTDFAYSLSRLTATIGTVEKTVNVTGSYPNINNATMNTIASYGNCMGMARLASSNSNVNPNNLSGWHHFINMSYNTKSDNMWQTLFAIKAGTTEVWVRSRAGGTVLDNLAWQAPWVRLVRTTDTISNADKLDGIHANGLLTALLSSSETNLSLTVGGTTKTISDLYATNSINSDMVDNFHATGSSGNVLRKSGCVTSNSAKLSSYWGKVASFTWVAQYSDLDVTLYMHSAYNSIRGIVHIRARWTSSTNVAINCWIVTGNIIASNLRLYYDSSSVSSPLELWYNIGSLYGTINTSVISETNRAGTETFRVTLYNTTFSTVLSPTISSYIQGSYIHLYNSVDSSIKLLTPRQINGTNFDGTANITTSYWGTARTLTIGNSAKSVNGSGNVSWSLSEIGAAAANHTHNYIVSRGNLNAQTGRTQSLGDVYSYNTTSGNTGGPDTYTSVIGFGRGTYGTVEIAGGWTSGMGLWYRALRDVLDNWFGWRKVWDTGNFNPSNYSLTSHNHDDRYVNITGDTMTGRLTFNGDVGIATSATSSLQLGMYTPTHIYLQTAGTLYYSPKSGTNYRIWHAGNFNPNNYMRVALANGYYGMVAPLGDTSAWIRTTSSGILPFQSGTSTSGHCSIGTSTWYFNSAYILNIYSQRMEASNGFYQLSDIRLKENIQKITSMSNIELVEFMWKKDKKKSYGVIALQVEKYFPELVNIDKETGYKSVNYDAILIIKIALLENKIKQLESKLL